MANNLRKFDNEESYNAATLVKPAASWIVDTNTVKFDPIEPTPPSFNGKYKFTLTDDSVVSGECDSSSAITTTETEAYKSTMKEAVVGDCVTNIGNAAFRDCRSLTSIEIPNSVTTINNQTFWNCTSLTSCTIPSSVTSISGYAFYNCNSLPSITIPSSVASIADYAFQSCTSLSSITVDSNNANYLSENGVLFNKAKSTLIQYPIGNSLTSYSIPSGVTSISDSAFRNCQSLTSIDIPSGVTNISKEAFRDSRRLTSVTVNATTPPTLGTSAFAGTTNCLIYVPSASVDAYKAASGWSNYADRITCVQPSFSGKYKFTLTDDSVVSGECDSSSAITTTETEAYKSTMKEAVIGDCVTSIGNYAFLYCSSLTRLNSDVDGVFNIPSSVTSIGNSAFYGCRGLTSIDIPSGVTSIDFATFSGCRGLTSIDIPSGVTNIGGSAFNDCSSLTSIDIPDSVTSIGNRAFEDCRLTSIDIPSGVTSIGDYAFSRCSSLASVTVNALTPPTLGGTSAFAGTTNCPIYVPAESVDAYKTANRWSTYASRIQAIS